MQSFIIQIIKHVIFKFSFVCGGEKTHVRGVMSDSQYRKTSSSSAEMQMICRILTKFRKGNFSKALPTKFFSGKNLTDLLNEH